jgi:hypothetical protein
MVSAFQAAKGTPATKWAQTNFFAGNARPEPTQVLGQLAETDTTRQAANSYVQQTAMGGAPVFYGREDSIHDWLYYVLGGKADSGSAGEFKHVLTPSATLPYITVGSGLGATLFEQYNDVMVSQLDLSAATGSPLTATATLQGLAAVRQAAEWSAGLAPPAASALAPFNFNGITVKLGGTETHLISSFNASIANGVALQQTDKSVPYDVVPGTFSVSMGFDLIFENLKEYNKFHYGGESGTEQSNEIFVTSASFEFKFSAKRSLLLTFPQIAYQTFPVNPDPSGAPVVAAVTAMAQRGASPFLTAEVINAVEKTL